MKKRTLNVIMLFVAVLVAMTTVNAAENGFYAGAHLGYGDQNQSKGKLFPFTSSARNEGLAARVSLGYQATEYFALESGFTMIDKDFFLDSVSNDWNLVAKGMLPITSNMNLYAKGGGAYVWQHGDDGLRFTYGLGASYDLKSNLALDANWMRVVGGDGIRDTNAVLVGINYYFGSA